MYMKDNKNEEETQLLKGKAIKFDYGNVSIQLSL